jgi:methionyl-tRNA formyltransferase
MVKPLRIVFMGTPEFAVPTLEALLASGHTVCGVITQPDRPRGRGQHVTFAPVKALAFERGLPVFQPDRLRSPDVEERLRAWAPDLGVVAAYGKLIPESLLEIPPLGMINVHASLLPLLRGAAPIHRAVIEGHAQTGVTIMRVVKALDSGAMFAKVTRVIGPDDTSDVVERDLARLGAPLLVSVVDQLAQGTAHEEAQDEAGATYAARLTKEEGLINWSDSAIAIHNRVRGLYPWPRAFTYLDRHRLIVLRTTPGGDSGHAQAGTVTRVSSVAVEVATGKGLLLLEDVQPEGRRPMGVREFVAGHPIAPGTRFTSAQDAEAGAPGLS